jgi:hypothetical protein
VPANPNAPTNLNAPTVTKDEAPKNGEVGDVVAKVEWVKR